MFKMYYVKNIYAQYYCEPLHKDETVIATVVGSTSTRRNEIFKAKRGVELSSLR